MVVDSTNSTGASLNIATKDNERARLERLCRYISRPAVSNQRLSLTRDMCADMRTL
jgi:hypothetical protein